MVQINPTLTSPESCVRRRHTRVANSTPPKGVCSTFDSSSSRQHTRAYTVVKNPAATMRLNCSRDKQVYGHRAKTTFETKKKSGPRVRSSRTEPSKSALACNCPAEGETSPTFTFHAKEEVPRKGSRDATSWTPTAFKGCQCVAFLKIWWGGQ